MTGVATTVYETESAGIVRFIKNVPFGDLPWEISGIQGL